MEKWFVYIIECKDKSLYTGCTNNLQRRFERHYSGNGGKYTASHKPVRIVFSEEYKNKSEALKREAQIKGWSRSKKLKFIESSPSQIILPKKN